MFSSSSYVLLIAVLEMYILPNITAIGSFLSYVCVINSVSLTLCTPAVFLLLNVDKYLIGWLLFSCLPAIKAGKWKWRESFWHSKSDNINHNVCLYTTIPYLHVSESFTINQYCALTSTILNGGTLSAYVMEHRFNTAVLGFQYKSILCREWRQHIRHSYHILVNSCY